MNRENGSNSSHPSEQVLALYAGGDLPRMTRLRLRRHISGCDACNARVHAFQSAKSELKHEAQSETLTGFEAIADWPRLEREMLGNIAVGVAAARCIDHVGRGRALFWRTAFGTGLLGLFIAAWATHIPPEQTQNVLSSFRQVLGLEPRHSLSPVVRTTPDGIAVRAQGATLTILHPPSAVVSLSGPSVVSARYVDGETGQVTITKVYGQ